MSSIRGEKIKSHRIYIKTQTHLIYHAQTNNRKHINISKFVYLQLEKHFDPHHIYFLDLSPKFTKQKKKRENKYAIQKRHTLFSKYLVHHISNLILFLEKVT